MRQSKQSFYTLSARLNEAEYQQFLKDCGGLSKSEYVRLCLFAKKMNKDSIGKIDKQTAAKILALMGKSRLFSNINQMAHAIHCGTLKLTPQLEATILELADDVAFIRSALMQILGKKV